NQRNKLANFKYLMLVYSSVKDYEIKLTDTDYKEYYVAHKNAFNNQEETRTIEYVLFDARYISNNVAVTKSFIKQLKLELVKSRTIEYVLFDARPTANDTAATKSVIEQLKSELVNSTTDSLFAAVNSDTKYPFAYLRKGQVSPALDSVIFNAPVGTTVGPFLSQDRFEVAKIVDAKFSPDSVKASHILLNTTAEGGVDKAQAKADSIKRLIQQGESFSALAIQFSLDEGSKINGGDLGTF